MLNSEQKHSTMSTLEEELAGVKKKIAAIEEEITKSKANNDREYMLKLMGMLEKLMGIHESLQKKENILLEKGKEGGNHSI